MKDVVIVSGARTAIGSFGGALKDIKASDLGAIAIREAVKRSGIAAEQVDEVVMGCVGQVAEDAFIARVSSLKAGIPVESTAITVNRLCSSGLQAIVTAAMEINNDDAGIVVAGGVESMSNTPYYLRNARWGYRMGHGEFEDGLVTALSDPGTSGTTWALPPRMWPPSKTSAAKCRTSLPFRVNRRRAKPWPTACSPARSSRSR